MAGTFPRTVLMVAYHFPPLRGSSGIQRTLRFCRYLPDFGWAPVVLTAHARAYEAVSDDLMADIPQGMPVHRAFALNTARHLAIGTRYPRLLAVPDRWVTWVLGGVFSGLAMIRRHRIGVLYSTYPIATAHLIGLVLHRLTGLPWVADFRDPMAQEGYPEDPLVWKSFRGIEARTVHRASRSIFTSPGAVREYRARYPDLAPERFELIENGYDEEAFAGLPTSAALAPVEATRRLVVVHSGIVYSSERDPTHLFEALGRLKRGGLLSARQVEFRFRASGNDALLERLAREHAISDLVTLAPAVPYADALAEMERADALLVMQAANCNSQIPAKAYEYLRAGRPILALSDPNGDTAGLMKRAGVEAIAPLDSVSALCDLLPRFVATLRDGTARSADPEFARTCSRRERTRALANVLDSVITTDPKRAR